MGFSRQEYWSGLPFPSARDLPDPGIEPRSLISPALQLDSLPTVPRGKPRDHDWEAPSLSRDPISWNTSREAQNSCHLPWLSRHERQRRGSGRSPSGLAFPSCVALGGSQATGVEGAGGLPASLQRACPGGAPGCGATPPPRLLRGPLHPPSARRAGQGGGKTLRPRSPHLTSIFFGSLDTLSWPVPSCFLGPGPVFSTRFGPLSPPSSTAGVSAPSANTCCRTVFPGLSLAIWRRYLRVTGIFN